MAETVDRRTKWVCPDKCLGNEDESSYKFHGTEMVERYSIYDNYGVHEEVQDEQWESGPGEFYCADCDAIAVKVNPPPPGPSHPGRRYG